MKKKPIKITRERMTSLENFSSIFENSNILYKSKITINDSTSKAMYSFPLSQRFQKRETDYSSFYYNIPSTPLAMEIGQQYYYLAEEKQIIIIIFLQILIRNQEVQNILLVLVGIPAENLNVLMNLKLLVLLIIFLIKNLDKMD